MNPMRFAIVIATRHPENLMLLGQRRDDSGDTGTRQTTTESSSRMQTEDPNLAHGAVSEARSQSTTTSYTPFASGFPSEPRSRPSWAPRARTASRSAALSTAAN